MNPILRKLLGKLTKEEALELLLSPEYYKKIQLTPKLHAELLKRYLESLDKDQLITLLLDLDDVNEVKKNIAYKEVVAPDGHRGIADPCSVGGRSGVGSRSC